MDTPKSKPDRSLIVILSAIATLVIVSLVVVLSRSEPELLDRSTPEGVVQAYTTAVLDGDEIAAAQFMTEAALESCDGFSRMTTEDVRLTLVSTNERADSADVRVLIVSSGGSGPFGASEWETEDVFDLVRVGGEWVISATPWQLLACPNAEVTS